jgi:predicted ATPase
MRIQSFRIENFRNLSLAECADVPSFVVICGGNGCGKSALLEALITAKEHAGAYGQFPFDSRAVSAKAEKATIQVELAFGSTEQEFVNSRFGESCPATDTIAVEINRSGGARVLKRSAPTKRLLSYYSRSIGSPGFFDFIGAYRRPPKSDLSTWDASFLSEQREKETLARPDRKFQLTKRYLTALKIGDLQALQTSLNEGSPRTEDSLAEIRVFFNEFFAPMRFQDVYIDRHPFAFIVETPMGDIDIDDLSSGEKEVLNTFIRFHQLKPSGAVILLDEADAHLHPDLGRRYLEVLREIASENQLILTTHSPEMMIAAGTEALYTLLKEPPEDGSNQLVRVTANEELHEALTELMGSRGLVSFNQRIVFIEGEDSSADRAVYEALYPPSEYSMSFVPAGNSATVRAAAEKVNALLSESTAFQKYYSIVDGDIERREADPTGGKRLHRLPVYHVENFLLDPELILEVTRAVLGVECPYSSPDEVEAQLKEAVLSEGHIKPFTGALLDARVADLARRASDAVFQQDMGELEVDRVDFATVEADARAVLTEAINDGTWKEQCKGRAVLKAYCGIHGINYKHFRNLLIERMESPPKALQDIMDAILAD